MRQEVEKLLLCRKGDAVLVRARLWRVRILNLYKFVRLPDRVYERAYHTF